MTMAAVNFLAFGAVGDACGAWCSRFTIKELMADFGCAEQTAKLWRQGKMPENRALVAMVARWGQPFLHYIFAPALAAVDRDLVAQLEAVEASVSLMRERIAHERRRSAALRLPAGAAGAGDGVAVVAAGGAGGVAERSGGRAGADGRKAARRGGVLAGLAAALMMTAAAYGPLAALFDHGDEFATRTGRAGRGDIRLVRAAPARWRA